MTTKKTKAPQVTKTKRSIGIAKSGLHTYADMGNLCDAMIEEVLTEETSTKIAGVAANWAGKKLKVVEMQEKYGRKQNEALLQGIANGRKKALGVE